MDNKYLNRKMIGWLSYNPNYEARDAQYRNNKVCYFYPRFLLQNGSYTPIDNKIDFPQVGRIAVWVQGGDDAESVVERYGNLVCATLNRSLECNYDSNNHYTARYNYDYGPKSSEIWITSVDSSAFYEVIECFQPADTILKNRAIDMPASFCKSSKYILLDNHRSILGPFSYDIQKNKLKLLGIPNFDYIAGTYDAITLEREMLIIRDNQDNDAVPLMPIENLPHPNSCKVQLDLIDDEELLNHFLEQAKIKLDLNRKDFREIKDYITRILLQKDAVDFNNDRLDRLQTILPNIFDVKNHILDTFTSLMTSPEISSLIVQELLKKYPDTLKESLASALGVGFTAQAADAKGAKAKENAAATSKDEPAITSISLPAVALPYDVINSFFNNAQMQSLINILQDAAKEISDKIEKVHEGTQIVSNEDLSLEDFISSVNFYPDYREQLSQQLTEIYNCLDNVTSFIDQVLGRDNDSTVDSKNPSAIALNELSIKLSRTKDRLTRRKQLLESEVKADEIDLTLDRLKSDTEIEAIQCTLADVLKDGHLLSQHISAPYQIECNRLQHLYANVDNVQNLETKLTELTSAKEELDTTIKQLEEKKTEQEAALKHISENFKEMVEPYKDQYKLAAKILDQNLIQSLSNITLGNNVPITLTSTNANIDASALATGNAQGLIANIGVQGQPVVDGQTPNQDLVTISNDNSNLDNQDSIILTDDVNQLKPLFNTECLDSPNNFETRKQLIDQLKVFFTKHAARNVSTNDLANYLICITQSFITTFAGEPGTGKTSLCNLLAQGLGLVREDQNNRFVEVSVERGWTSLKDFIGYYNPLTKRMEKSNAEIFDAFYELNKEGLALHSNPKHPNHLEIDKLAPFFILLDEANLSPIEHYWAAFFRNCDDIAKQQRTISLGGKANWYLPENLRFLATINIDHTTEELSARFLDRSWVITLDPQEVDMETPDVNDDLLYKDKIVPFATLKKLFTPQSEDTLPKEIVTTWETIQQIFNSNECALTIRPRNLKMVHNYCLIASSCMNCHGEFGRLAPLDYAVAQKILPTINGNGDRYRILIEKLREVCLPELMPLCAKHLERMQRTGGAELGFYQFFSR